MTPYLLKYFHNTQHVLPQVMSGQACNVSLYLSLTNIRAHQSFLLSIVCSGSPSTDLYTRGCRLGLDQPEEGSLPAVLLMHSKLTQGTAWLTCSCALHVPVSYTSLCLTHSCLTCPCVVHVPVPYMFSYLTCSSVLHVPVPYMSLCLICLCVLHIPVASVSTIISTQDSTQSYILPSDGENPAKYYKTEGGGRKSLNT